MRSHRKLNAKQVSEFLQQLVMDIWGPVECNSADNPHVLIIVGYFMKCADSLTVKNQMAQKCTRYLVLGLVSRYSIPQQLLGIQGTQFEAGLFQEMCKLLGLLNIRTTLSYVPSDSLSKKKIRTIKDI